MDIKNIGKGKHLIWILVLILIMGGFYYYQNKDFKLKLDENGNIVYPHRRLGEPLRSYQEKIVVYEKDYIKYLEEFNKQDNYGGETPEETLALYIQALESGDFELASKYFRLQDQKKELRELEGIDQSQLDDYLKKLKLEIKSTYFETFDEYELGVYDNKGYLIVAKTIKNKETNIWKLESI